MKIIDSSKLLLKVWQAILVQWLVAFYAIVKDVHQDIGWQQENCTGRFNALEMGLHCGLNT